MKIETRTTNRGKRFRARFMMKYKRYFSPWLESENEAKDWAANEWNKARKGNVAVCEDVRLSHYAEEIWLKKHSFANKVYSSALRDQQVLRIYILPKLGNKKLQDIKTVDIEFILADLKAAGKLKPKTLNNILGTVKKMLNDAVRWGFITHNPASLIRPMKLNNQQVTVFSRDEVTKVLAFAKESYPEEYNVLEFALNTGCRLGECLALQWRKVDLKGHFVIIDSTFDERQNIIVARTKGKRFRKVPLNDTCLKLLGQLVIEGRRNESDVVFSRVKYKYMTNKFKMIMRKCGLNEALERGATFHTTRHTFASEYMKSKGTLYELQQLLGHHSVQQTERYAHFAPEYLVGLTDKVDFTAPEGRICSLNSSQSRTKFEGLFAQKFALNQS